MSDLSDEMMWELDLRKFRLKNLVIVFLIFVLLAPSIGRLYKGNSTVVGSESYLNIRYAEELLEYKDLTFGEFMEKLADTPDLVYSRRSFNFNPYQVLLAFVGNFTGVGVASRVLPLISGILSGLIFYFLLKRFGIDDYRRCIYSLMLFATPAFIYAFNISTSHSLAILFTLFSFYAYTRRTNGWFFLSVVSLVLLSFFSLFNIVLLLLLMIAYSWKFEDSRRRLMIALFSSMIFVLFRGGNLFASYTTHESMSFFTSILSDLGGLIGFGFVVIALAFMGFGVLWKKRLNLLFFIVPLMILGSYVYVGEGFFMYLSFFVAIVAGEGFIQLSDSDWSLRLLKSLTILILVCGVVFSMVSYTSRLVDLGPNPELLHSLELLKKSSKGGELVLTHPKFGYLVEAVADRKVFADSLSIDKYDQKFLYKVSDSIFSSRSLEEVQTLIESYGIDYIWVTPEMKSGLTWSKDEEGLLFILEKSEMFKKLYSTYGYDIWSVEHYSPVERVFAASEGET